MERGRVIQQARRRVDRPISPRFALLAIGLPLLVAVMLCATVGVAEEAAPPPQDSSAAEETDEALNELSEELDADDDIPATVEESEVMQNDSEESERRQSTEQRDRLTQDPKWRPTHTQIGKIEVGTQMSNFCLDAKGRILACCNDQKIRVFSQEGALVATWELAFVPQAIGLRKADGSVFVGGDGQLARLTSDGKVAQQEAFPRPMTDEEIEAAVQAQLAAEKKTFEGYLSGLKSQLADVEKALAAAKKDEATPKAEPSQKPDEEEKNAEEEMNGLFATVKGITSRENGIQLEFAEGTPLATQAKVLRVYLESIEQQYGGPEKLEKELRERMKASSETCRYTGLAVAENDLFVIASAPGYSYNAWRTSHALGDAKLIVKGLRGCCGQMDCQTFGGDLWIPMNTQHKVCRYDRDGKELSSFGQEGRDIAEAFGGCCEPKNMRFDEKGFAYCAESGPPVCVKRFTQDGQFQDVVCFPVYATGCVRVSVDLWEDKVFLLSPTENAIYVFAPGEKGGAKHE